MNDEIKTEGKAGKELSYSNVREVARSAQGEGCPSAGAARAVEALKAANVFDAWASLGTSCDDIARIIDRESGLSEMLAALTKINHIRNSIVGLATVNWSEHVYPLVAALDEAGMQGMGYPEAREYYGTMLERTNKAEALAEELREALEAIVDCYGLGQSPEKFVKQVAGFIDDARAAIAKATGASTVPANIREHGG